MGHAPHVKGMLTFRESLPSIAIETYTSRKIEVRKSQEARPMKVRSILETSNEILRRLSNVAQSSILHCFKNGLMWQGACLVVAEMLLSTPVALSQGSVGGRVSGRVTDPDGAVVPGASISEQNTNTNINQMDPKCLETI
jgi:hypothetical protein